MKNKPDKDIGDLLMDQQIFAGVGNKIRVEALYRAGVHPFSKVAKIPPTALAKLITAVRRYAKSFIKILKKPDTIMILKLIKKITMMTAMK
ncbi:hypothetical protein MKP09_18555 [Niabella ginsengisoli]|uniref:Formamidopyrimidine-DNA glycosylase H2TH DNA-binding domain-containing protein n=1 Tax=Niabella ginsengisoli TaxID=522298 RepID=A0ABS9SN56_9BACT|nr:hypothetical protein [Niabella ginsengisoli]